MIYGVLALYPLMALGVLIQGMVVTATLRWMMCRIANSGTMILLINIQIDFVHLTVAWMRRILNCMASKSDGSHGYGPHDDTLSGYELLGYELPGYELPGYELPGYELHVYELPGYETLVMRHWLWDTGYGPPRYAVIILIFERL
jgi:hypothetical protein